MPGPTDPNSRLDHSLAASGVSRPVAPTGAPNPTTSTGTLAGGRFVVQGCMAEGGMGAVYRGWDVVEGRAVAIKVMKPGVTDPQDLSRFSREAIAGRALDHPNIVRVHTVGTAPGGAPFLVMDLIDGESLHERVRRSGPLEPAEAARLLARCARALEHSHGRGVLHRDLKPANILVDRAGEPFLVDFGVVKLVGQGRLTATGEALGTPNYMAPEQAHGDHDRVGPATDVYGLGATLHELLTGRPPFNGASVLEVMEKVITATPEPVRQLRPEVDPALEAVVTRCLAKAPEERFPSAGALALALEQLARGKARPGRADRRKRRVVRSAAAGLAVVGVVAGAAIGGAVWSGRAHPPAPTRPAPTLPAPAMITPTIAPSPSTSPAAEALRLADRGEELRAAGDRPGATEAFERALALDPRCVEALVGRGRVRFSLREYEAARADLERAALAAPQDPAPLGYLARTLQNLNDAPAALATVERALALGPNAEAHATRAGIRLARGEFAQALPDCVAACELAPNEANYANNLGIALQMTGDLEGAVRTYGQALAVDPKLASALQNRAQCLVTLRRPAEAVADLGRLLELRPDPALHVERGRLRVAAGDVTGASEDAAAALRLRPGHAGALAVRAGAKAQGGDIAGALLDVDAAMSASAASRPSEATPAGDLLELRGELLRVSGDLEGARQDWTAAAAWFEQAGEPGRAQGVLERRRKLDAGEGR